MFKFSIEKIWSEMKEHTPSTILILKRVLVPLIPVLIIINFIFKLEIIPVLLLGFLPFLYGSFLPDFDSLMKFSKSKNSPLLYKSALLLFGILYIYYFVFGKTKLIYSNKKKEFHSFKYALYYLAFLFVFSFLIFSIDNLYKHIIFSILGFFGYSIHLLIDRKFHF